MKRYDPLDGPAPEEWLDLKETQRLSMVADYHRHARVQLPNVAAHAPFTLSSKTRQRSETRFRQRTLDRLMQEGIDRHEAIHAVATVLAEHVSDLARNPPPQADPNARYFATLETTRVLTEIIGNA